jgi:hypothetical protein
MEACGRFGTLNVHLKGTGYERLLAGEILETSILERDSLENLDIKLCVHYNDGIDRGYSEIVEDSLSGEAGIECCLGRDDIDFLFNEKHSVIRHLNGNIHIYYE